MTATRNHVVMTSAKRQRVPAEARSLLVAIPKSVLVYMLTFLSTSDLWPVQTVAKMLPELSTLANRQREHLILTEAMTTLSPFRSGRLCGWLRTQYSPTRVTKFSMECKGAVPEFVDELAVAFPQVKELWAADDVDRVPPFPRLEMFMQPREHRNLDAFSRLVVLDTVCDLDVLAGWSRLPQLQELKCASAMDIGKLSRLFQRCAALRTLTVSVMEMPNEPPRTLDAVHDSLRDVYRTIGTVLAASCPDLENLGMSGNLDEALALGGMGWPFLAAFRNIRAYCCSLASTSSGGRAFISRPETDIKMRQTLKGWPKLGVLSIKGLAFDPSWFETDLEAASTMHMTWISWDAEAVYDLALVARFHIRFPKTNTLLPDVIKFSLATADVDWSACCSRLWYCCFKRALHSATDSYDPKTAQAMEFRLVLQCKSFDVLVNLVPHLNAAPSMVITGSPEATIDGAFLRSFRAKHQHMVTSVTWEGRMRCEPDELDDFLSACPRLRVFILGTCHTAVATCNAVGSAAAALDCIIHRIPCEYRRVLFVVC